MSKWEEKQLGSVCSEIFSGGTPSTLYPEYWNGEIPWLSSGETSRRYIYNTEKTITELGAQNSSTRLAKNGDIVIACAGQGKTRGQVSTIKRDMYINQSVIAIRGDSKNADTDFIYYNLLLRYDELRYLSDASSTRGSITTEMLKKLKIILPDLPTQQRIADILSAYDDLIENNNKRIALLEKAAQELYKEWFVRFRFPGHETTKFVNGLPEGWEVKRISDIFEVTSSKRVYLSDYVEKGIPFYRSKEIIQLASGQAITECLYISESTFNAFNSKFGAPKQNDILITSVGTIGVSYLVDGHTFYFKDGNLTWIKSSVEPKLALFLYRWLNSSEGKQQLLLSTIGTSQSALTIENLKKNKLIVPSNNLINDYYLICNGLIRQKRALQMKNQNLAKQRDLLLPRLMSGKLEV